MLITQFTSLLLLTNFKSHQNEFQITVFGKEKKNGSHTNKIMCLEEKPEPTYQTYHTYCVTICALPLFTFDNVIFHNEAAFLYFKGFFWIIIIWVCSAFFLLHVCLRFWLMITVGEKKMIIIWYYMCMCMQSVVFSHTIV